MTKRCSLIRNDEGAFFYTDLRDLSHPGFRGQAPLVITNGACPRKGPLTLLQLFAQKLVTLSLLLFGEMHFSELLRAV